jgi:hypothetical protein
MNKHLMSPVGYSPSWAVRCGAVNGGGTVISIDELWHSHDPQAWRDALKRYWCLVKPSNMQLEQALDQLDIARIRTLDAEGWFNFLLNEYFRWKYTAPNRYKSTTKQLQRYRDEEGGLQSLDNIRLQLLNCDVEQIEPSIRIACGIRGLGVAGASGLLSLMYPTKFGTVDQFVVKALREVSDLPEAQALAGMIPENLTLLDGGVLTRILRRKSAELNQSFGTNEWNPRALEMVLWTYGR